MIQQLLEVDSEQSAMRGRLATADSVRRFIEAGNATLTLASRGSGQRFTFKFQRAQQRPETMRNLPEKDLAIFVKVLSGPDNESDYQFIGTLFPPNLGAVRTSGKSRVRIDAPSFRALAWMLNHLYGEGLGTGGIGLLRQAELWHEGRCGRCGRKLTVPESIATGFGPDCASQMERGS